MAPGGSSRELPGLGTPGPAGKGAEPPGACLPIVFLKRGNALSKATIGLVYVGLTDDLEACRRRHGDPEDWRGMAFPSEEQARGWVAAMLAAGCLGGPSNRGWRHGYHYTIGEGTVE